MFAFRTHDLVREIEDELGGELSAYHQYIVNCEVKKLFPNGVIPPEQIEEVTGVIMQKIF